MSDYDQIMQSKLDMLIMVMCPSLNIPFEWSEFLSAHVQTCNHQALANQPLVIFREQLMLGKPNAKNTMNINSKSSVENVYVK